MRGRSFVSVITVGGLALVFAELVPVDVTAEDVATAGRPADTTATGTTNGPSSLIPLSSNPIPSPGAIAPEFGNPGIANRAGPRPGPGHR